MNIKSIIRIQFKSVQRKNGYLLLFISVGVAVLSCILGYYWSDFITGVNFSPLVGHLFFIFTFYGLLSGDYIIKLMAKRNLAFPSLIKCMPSSNKLYIRYYLLKEACSVWNLYVPLFFVCPAYQIVVPRYGFATAIMLCLGIYLFSLLISNIVASLNMKTYRLVFSVLFLLFLPCIISPFLVFIMAPWKWVPEIILGILACLNAYFVASNSKLMKYWDGKNRNMLSFYGRNSPGFHSNPLLMYTLLHLRMILRSSRLRHQLGCFIGFTLVYLYIIVTKDVLTENYIIHLMGISMILIFCPLSLNQYIFSAEGAYFERLILSPSFPFFLKSRYLGYVLLSSVVFIILICALWNHPEFGYELFAVFFYSIGVILPMSFLSIFFADHKHDIAKLSKAWTDQPMRQGLFIIVICVGLYAIVFLISHLFSIQAATHFMFFSGLIFGLFSLRWLTIIQKYYLKHTKYKHLENYKK